MNTDQQRDLIFKLYPLNPVECDRHQVNSKGKKNCRHCILRLKVNAEVEKMRQEHDLK